MWGHLNGENGRYDWGQRERELPDVADRLEDLAHRADTRCLIKRAVRVAHTSEMEQQQTNRAGAGPNKRCTIRGLQGRLR